MKKEKVILIAVLMGLALTGLIILQVYWIQHDLAIRRERFSEQVTRAMNNAVARLETTESVQLLTSKIPDVFQDSVLRYFSRVPHTPVVPPVPPVPPVSVVPPEFVFDFDTLQLVESEVYTIVNGDDSESVTTIVRGNKGNRITVAVSGMKEKQAKLERAAEALKKEKLVQRKALIELEKSRAKMKFDQMKSVYKKMAVEFDMRNAELLERLDPTQVDSLIGKELKNNGINIPYAISINNGTNDSILWNRPLPGAGMGEKEYRTTLFPGDIINRNDYVRLGFADTFRYFISSMWLMVMSSFIFTFIIILAFSYTVYVIFRQKKLSDIKNDFINNMTHEFKTPIATIKLASEAMRNPEVTRDPDKVSYYSKIINDENERMNSHVENILQMAQFDKKAFAPHLEATDMHEVISRSIDNFRLQAQEKGGQITFIPGASNAVIMADPSYIPFAINNLLDNSLKYCNRYPEIMVETATDNGKLVIKVTDNGIGMDKSTMHKIFDKFYRVTTGNIHNVKGFGLGLNYVKAIVTAHNGNVSVESEPGRGSTFTIVFSLSRQQ